MTTVSQILAQLEQIAPPELKMSWDNVGLLCGDPQAEVTKILVSLDPFEGVADEAIETGAQLIVTHHPLIFRPCQAVTTQTSIGRTILKLSAHGISAINAHTNLDCAAGGVNDVLASILGLDRVEKLPDGLVRMGTVAEQPLPDFLCHVKNKLHTPTLRYVDGGKPVHRVAVGGGACGDFLTNAYDAGCDTFVTSDIKYNQFWDAHDLGLNLIDAGHFYTENPVCAAVQARLQAAFPQMDVVLSKKHRDCMKFF